jgi:hypothetical protein
METIWKHKKERELIIIGSVQQCEAQMYLHSSIWFMEKKKSLKGTWIGTHVVKQGVQAANDDKEY